MSEEFVGIRIGLEGDEKALASLKELQKLIKDLNKRSIRIRTNNAQINKLLTALKNVQKEVNKINGKTVGPKGNDSGPQKVIKAVRNVNKEITKVNGRSLYVRPNNSGINTTTRKLKEADNIARRFTRRPMRLNIETGEVKKAEREFDNLEAKKRRTEYPVNIRVNTTRITEAGRALTNFGNTLTNLANNPFTNTFRQLGTSMIAQFSNVVTEGLQKTVSRYDTMRVFPQMMQAMGFTAKQSEKAIHDLDMSVRGLPTALNEITDAANQYALTTGDIEKGTKYAIAANRAFLASASSEAQQYQGRLQLNDLFAGKKLNSREWMSLAASMPAAIREIGKVLGYKDTGKFRQMLFANQIAAEDFTEALVKVGTKGGKIYEMAEISKTTLAGLISNTKIAISRLGEGILGGLDEAFKIGTGKGLVANIRETLIPAIDSITQKVKSWIKANPDKIMKFFDALKSFDWAGLGRGMLAAGKAFAGLMKFFTSVAPTPLLGFILAGGTAPFGRLISGLGTLIISYGKLRGAMADINATSKGGLFTRLFSDRRAAQSAADGAAATASATSRMSMSVADIGRGFLRAIRPAGVILAYAGTFVLVAKALKEIGDTNVDLKKSASNIGKIAVGMTAMTAYMRGMTALTNVLGNLKGVTKLGKIGRAIGSVTWTQELATGLMTIVDSGVFWAVGKAMEQISKIDFGSGFDIHGKIAKIGLAIVEMKGLMTVLGGISTLQWGTLYLGALEAIGDLAAIMTSETFRAVADTLDKIGRLKIPSNTKIADTFKALVKVKEGLVSDDMMKSLKDAGKLWKIEDSVRGLEEATSKLVNVLKNIDKIKTNLDTIGKKKIEEKTVTTAVDNIKTITGSFGSLYKAIEEMAQGDEEAGVGDSYWAVGKNKMSSKIENYASALGQMNNALTNIQSISTALIGVKKKFAALQKAFGLEGSVQHGASPGNTLNTKAIETMISGFTTLINDLVTGEGGLGELQLASKQMENVNVENIGEQIGEIGGVMDKLNALKKKLSGETWLMPENGAVNSGKKNEFGLFDTLVSGAYDFTTSKPGRSGAANGLLTAIQGLVQVVTDIATELAKVESLGLEGKAKTLQKAISGVKKAVGYMSQLRTSVSEDSKSKVDVVTHIQTMITNLSTALNGSDTLNQKVFVFSTAVAGLKSALEALSNQNDSISTLLDTLGKIPSTVQTVSDAVRGKGKEWQEEIAGGLEGTAERVKAEMDKVAAALKRDFSDQGSSAGDSFVNAFNAAFANIRTSVSAPTVSGGMSWRERIGGHQRRISNGGTNRTKTGGFITTAGVLYRKMGGAVGFPGRPKGIDKIPVWMADGEFVMNRQATRTLGPKVLQQMNHGNWKEAFDELSGRMSARAVVPGHVTVDRSRHTNIYNNQQVTQNIGSANEEFSAVRMSRYLRRM